MENQQANIIHEKLILFKKKFELRNLFRGLIVFAAGFLSIGTLIAIAEYFFHFNGTLRMVLFISFLGLLIYSFTTNIAFPIFKYLGWKEGISDFEAARLIGDHFSEISDQLNNLIQLEQQGLDNALLRASIEQKAKHIQPFEFKEAVSFEKLTKLGRIALIPFFIVVVISLLNKDVFTGSANRIVNFNEEFAPKNPYRFKILNESFNVIKNNDYTLTFEFTGDEIPQNVYVNLNEQKLRCYKSGPAQYSFDFRNVQNNLRFYLLFEKFSSANFNINVKEKPIIQDFEIALDYPKYVGKTDEKVSNNGDLIIPEGTKVKWNFSTQHTNQLTLKFADSTYALTATADETIFQSVFNQSQGYSIHTEGKDKITGDALEYYISVIRDEYPKIKVSSFTDSVNPYLLFNSGIIADDYGFNKLAFVFNSKDTSGQVLIPIPKNTVKHNFNYGINIKSLEIKEDTELSYYFEVFDNDGVHGSKSKKSEKQVYKSPSKKSVQEIIASNNKGLKEELSENLQNAKQIQEEFNRLQKMLLEKPKLDWSDRQQVSDFLNKQKELEQKIEQLKFNNEKNNYQKQELTQQEQDILEKQQKVNKLFDELMDEKTKKMYEELQKLMEDFKQEDLKEKLEEINLNNEELEKELDRTLELFKQMEFDQQLQESIDELQDLSKEQEKLSEETKNNEELSEGDLQKKQEELNKKFEDIKQKMDDLKEKNNELENKRDLENTETEEQEIQQDQKESSEQLEKQNRKKSSKSQKDAAEKMKKLAEKMQSMQQEMQMEQQMEDIQSLRQILENLITLSFEQEDLMEKIQSTNKYDPQFPILATKQGDLKESAKIIEDSLQALSKRQIALSSIINKEIMDINYNMNKSIDFLRERQNMSAAVKQQYVMTAANNLALMLDESLQQMQEQMMQNKMGTSSCNKPGGSGQSQKPSMQQMKQQLSQQLEQMKKMMQEGKKPGEDGKNGKTGMAKQLAKMSAEQRALQQQLKKLEQQQKQGEGGLGELEQIQKKLNENQKDILNNNITSETIMRQEQILSKLLEADKSIRERDLEKKREANSNKNEFNRNPTDFTSYKSFELKQKESLKTIPPSFNLFYKRRISDYFNTFED